MAKSKIKGKIVWLGQIECLSPIHIGSGRGERSDLDIMLDCDRLPIIPATSFVGILRHAFEERFSEKFEPDSTDPRFKNFWGYTEEKDGQQSALNCSDLSCISNESPEMLTRDGIRIDPEKGIVKRGGKFDFELLERGSKFALKMEFTFREDNEDFVKKTVRTIYELLRQRRVRLGAKTNSGLGQISLVESVNQIYVFDFTDKSDVFKWLTQKFQPENAVTVETLGDVFDLPERRFRIIATLKLKSSLIVRADSHAPEMPDTTQLKSGNDWVIPGSSIKGAIRARAERIVNTLQLPDAKIMVTNLFGNVEDERRSKNAKKGRIRVQEVILKEDDFPAELQTRIRVDRFTGGVIEGALFDSMPVFATDEDKTLELHLEIENYKNYEAGLLLLVLKDLWSGDLAVGGEKNIGRGVLKGVRAEITWEDKKIILEKDITKLSHAEKNQLQRFVAAITGERS